LTNFIYLYNNTVSESLSVSVRVASASLVIPHLSQTGICGKGSPKPEGAKKFNFSPADVLFSLQNS